MHVPGHDSVQVLPQRNYTSLDQSDMCFLHGFDQRVFGGVVWSACVAVFLLVSPAIVPQLSCILVSN